MRRFVLVWLWSLVCTIGSTAAAAPPTQSATTPTAAAPSALPPPAPGLPPDVELPVRVRLSLRVLNVTQVQETADLVRMAIETTQRWNDPRLRFDPVQAGSRRKDHVGDAATRLLKTMWTPGLAADNQTGDKEGFAAAISVHANGDVTLVERYESNFRARMDMRAFPFDRQQLTLGFSLPLYATQEAVLVNTEADRQFSGIEPSLSVTDWRPLGVHFAHQAVTGWNARNFSRMNATVGLERIAEGYLLRMFIPIVAVLLVSVFVLWVPSLTLNDKGNLIFSSLLALAAISFTFEASFPGSISLDTPVAEMVSLGYFYLVGILLLDTLLAPRSTGMPSPHRAALRWHLRWAAPVLMAIICVGAVVRTAPFD
jgi:hypothetical protein